MNFNALEHVKEVAGVAPPCPGCRSADQWVPCSYPQVETFARAKDGTLARIDTHGILCVKCGGIILIAAPLDDVAGP